MLVSVEEWMLKHDLNISALEKSRYNLQLIVILALGLTKIQLCAPYDQQTTPTSGRF